MSRHRCDLWTALGINCPEGLLTGARERAGIGEAPSDDEIKEEHDLSKAPVPVDGFELERRVFIELERKIQREKSVRQRTVEALRNRETARSPIPVLTPSLILREAAMQGARGPEATVWVAAAIATLAVGSAAALAIPGVIRSIKGAARGRGGGVGFRLNDAARIKLLLEGGFNRRFRQGGGAAQGGDDFQGLLG